jgi:hypothetical protein
VLTLGHFFFDGRRHMKSAIAGVIVFGLAALLSPAHAQTWVFKDTIPVPASAFNTPTSPGAGLFKTFDISFFDPATGLDYVADRSNAAVDVFAAPSDTFATRIGGTPPTFAGQTASNATSGPDGVQVVNMGTQHQVWVGDSPSLLWSFKINPPTNAPTFSTAFPTLNTGGGQFRVDEMSFDPIDNTLLVANNANTPAFGTLVNAQTGAVIASNITVPQGGANGGLEASDFNPVTKTFFLAVPQINGGNGPQGGVAEINGKTGALIRVIDLAAIGACPSGCSPTGLAAAKNGQILIGDGNSGKPGSTAGAMIIDPTGATVKVIATFPQVNGIDQVWYDPTTNKWFLAAGNNGLDPMVPGSNKPELVIIDAATDMITQIINTTPGDHSVSVDPLTGEIFLPLSANGKPSVCPDGCVEVFALSTAVPESSTWAMMLLGFLGLAFAFRTKRRVLGVA